MDIGKNIKEIREKKGMTQEELAEQVNVKQHMISQIERGTRAPSMPLGKDIATALGCKIEDLYA